MYFLRINIIELEQDKIEFHLHCDYFNTNAMWKNKIK